MLNRDEITALAAQIRREGRELMVRGGLYTAEEIEKIDDFWEKHKRTFPPQVVGDVYPVDIVYAVARHFSIEFDTLRVLDTRDVDEIFSRYLTEHASKEEFNEAFPQSFEELCENEAQLRKDMALIKKVGILKFFEIRKAEREKRKQREQSPPKPIFPVTFSPPKSRH